MRLTALESGIAQALRGLGHPSAGERVVVGLSGGPDSVALLDVMAALARRRRFTVVAAHLDHGLRPDSARDAAFCAEVCVRLGVSLRTGQADVKARRLADGGGLEEAARLERHAFLHRVKGEETASFILLAHTRDDQAETVLLRLVRGAGGTGLSAMRPRAGDLLRPMLGLSRRDVMDHLAARSLAWREDPTNADLAIARNRVRHELLPYLERHFNPAVREALARSAAVFAEESDVLATVADDARRARGRADEDGSVLSIDALRGAPRAVARLTVRRALQQAGGLRGVGLKHVESILDLAATAAPSGRRVALPGGREAVFHFGEVRITPRHERADAFALPLPVPGTVALPDGRHLVARAARGPAVSNGVSTVVAVPDGPLEVRTRRPGDRVRAAGREVSLRRFLMDKRVPAADRGSLPLVAAGHRVFWVPGQRLDGADAATQRFVRVEVVAGHGEAPLMEKPEVLFTPEQIAARIRQIGSEVARDFDGKEIAVVGLIKSCMVFMADIVRAIPLDMTCHFLRVSSLREGSAGSTRTDIVYSTEIAYEDRHILLLDDIIDTGITLNFLLDHIRERRPRSLKVAALIDKPGDRKIEVQVDWAAFTLKESSGDRFLVGYGLDYAERFRGLPYIGTIPRPDKPGEARTISIAPGR